LEHRIQAGIDRRRLFELAGIGAISLAAPLPLHALPRREYSALQAKVAEYIDQQKAAGIVLAIGQNDEEPDIVKKGRLAFDSTVPVNENSLFRIYSMTKPITGMAAMILHQEGKITLDQPIADFLPEFGEMRVLTQSGIDPDEKANNPAPPADAHGWPWLYVYRQGTDKKNL